MRTSTVLNCIAVWWLVTRDRIAARIMQASYCQRLVCMSHRIECAALKQYMYGSIPPFCFLLLAATQQSSSLQTCNNNFKHATSERKLSPWPTSAEDHHLAIGHQCAVIRSPDEAKLPHLLMTTSLPPNRSDLRAREEGQRLEATQGGLRWDTTKEGQWLETAKEGQWW